MPFFHQHLHLGWVRSVRVIFNFDSCIGEMLQELGVRSGVPFGVMKDRQIPLQVRGLKTVIARQWIVLP